MPFGTFPQVMFPGFGPYRWAGYEPGARANPNVLELGFRSVACKQKRPIPVAARIGRGSRLLRLPSIYGRQACFSVLTRIRSGNAHMLRKPSG